MRKRLVAIYSVLVVAIVLLAVLFPSCTGAGKGTIEVKATLCGDPWPTQGAGAVNYTLTLTGGPSPINGTEVPDSFTVATGTWACEYVSGGPDGVYCANITPSSQTVSEGETKTFTLNFELEQDASIEFVSWTIDGQFVAPNKPEEFYWVSEGSIIGVCYQQLVTGCQGKVVKVKEDSGLWTHYVDGVPAGGTLRVDNDICAVNKTPEPVEKVSQVASFNGTPVEPGTDHILWRCEPRLLGVETVWLLEKCTNYTNTINWLRYAGGESCALFELLPMGWGIFEFTLDSYASVELVGDEDVDPGNNYAESPPLYIRVLSQ